MSYPLQSYLVGYFGNDAAILPLLGVQANGRPGVYPYHHRDIVDPVYPIITIARYGSMMNQNKFSDGPFATIMDGPKIAICVYDKQGIDKPWKIYRRIRQLLIDKANAIGDSTFTAYKFRETLVRDDLYDTAENSFHLHAEYEGWIQENSTTPIAIPT